MKVCSEESLLDIQDRYLALNAHAKGYTWKRLGKVLDMTLTLDGNGVEGNPFGDEDEEDLMDCLEMNFDEYLPVIQLYFSDDLTVA
jgi:hypothetical protein